MEKFTFSIIIDDHFTWNLLLRHIQQGSGSSHVLNTLTLNKWFLHSDHCSTEGPLSSPITQWLPYQISITPTTADFFKSPLKLVFLVISDGISKSLRDTTTVCKKQNQHYILEIYGSEGSTKPYPSLAHKVDPFRVEEHWGNIYYCVRILKSEYHS